MKLSRFVYMAGYGIRAKFLNDKRPILAGIKLTHQCTLKCRQCPYWRRPTTPMSWIVLVSILSDLYDKGIRIVIFEGGEPMLWRDGDLTLADAINEAKRLFFCVGVATNGTLPLNNDPDIFWVSIDGLKEHHDELRGKSFERVISNISNSDHPKIFANITINRVNAAEIPELVRLLAPLVKGITVQFFYPYPECEDLVLGWDERARVLERLIELKRLGYPISDSVSALNLLKNNNWKCESWMIASVEPDGMFTQGCYLKNRAPDKNPCRVCGFAAHTEISLAYQLHWDAIKAGREILSVF